MKINTKSSQAIHYFFDKHSTTSWERTKREKHFKHIFINGYISIKNVFNEQKRPVIHWRRLVLIHWRRLVLIHWRRLVLIHWRRLVLIHWRRLVLIHWRRLVLIHWRRLVLGGRSHHCTLTSKHRYKTWNKEVKRMSGRKEGNVLYNKALNTFYRTSHRVKDHWDRERKSAAANLHISLYIIVQITINKSEKGLKHKAWKKKYIYIFIIKWIHLRHKLGWCYMQKHTVMYI